jgi:hypothetical protein
MNLKSVIAAGCLVSALAIAGNASSTNVFFSDHNFGPGWVYTLSGIRSGGTETHGASTPATGGDPGSFESEKHSLTSPVGGPDMAAYFSNFDPIYSFTGSFVSVSYGWDLNDLGAFGVGYSLAIQQNGVVYVHSSGNLGAVFPPSGWANGQNPFQGATLHAVDFCAVTNPLGTSVADHFLDCNQNPVFSSPTQMSVFGIAVANSFTANGNSASYASGIDNWCVELKNAVGTVGSGGSTKKCKTRK